MGSLTTVEDPLTYTRKKKTFRNNGESGCGWLYQNPKSPGNTAKTQQSTENQKNTEQKYKLSEVLVFTFRLPGYAIHPSAPRQ